MSNHFRAGRTECKIKERVFRGSQVGGGNCVSSARSEGVGETECNVSNGLLPYPSANAVPSRLHKTPFAHTPVRCPTTPLSLPAEVR